MKKIICILLLLIMSAVFFAGCEVEPVVNEAEKRKEEFNNITHKIVREYDNENYLKVMEYIADIRTNYSEFYEEYVAVKSNQEAFDYVAEKVYDILENDNSMDPDLAKTYLIAFPDNEDAEYVAKRYENLPSVRILGKWIKDQDIPMYNLDVDTHSLEFKEDGTCVIDGEYTCQYSLEKNDSYRLYLILSRDDDRYTYYDIRLNDNDMTLSCFKVTTEDKTYTYSGLNNVNYEKVE